MQSSHSVKRGDVLRVRLDPEEGSEQAGDRPVLVISPDIINASSPVILVAAITSQKVDRIYPFEARIEPPEGGLTRLSKVMLMQLRAINKRRILSRYGSVSNETMGNVDFAIQIATGIIAI